MGKTNHDVTFNSVNPTNDSWDYRRAGLTQEGAILVGLGSTIITFGAVSGFSELVATNLATHATIHAGIQGGVHAAVGSIISKTSVNTVNQRGNVVIGTVNTLEDITSKHGAIDFAKNIGTAALSAGIVQHAGLSDLTKIEGSRNLAILQREVIRAGVRGAIYPETIGDIAKSTLQNAALGMVHNKIGDIGIDHGLKDGGFEKVMMHSVAGGLFADATGRDFKYGAIAGGLGELTSSFNPQDSGKARAPIDQLVASVGTFMARGKAKDMDQASRIAGSGHEYNNRLHLLKKAFELGTKLLSKKAANEGAKIAVKEGSKEVISTAAKETAQTAGKNLIADSTKEAAKTLPKFQKRAITKEYKAIEVVKEKAREVLQGNNKDLKKPTHIYKIYDRETKVKDKIGESAGKINKRDKSIRAETQVKQKNKIAGYDKYDSKILRTYPDKATGRKFETKLIDKIRQIEGSDALPGNKNNR